MNTRIMKKELTWINKEIGRLCDKYGETPVLMATQCFETLITADKMTTAMGHPKGDFYRDLTILLSEMGKRAAECQ